MNGIIFRKLAARDRPFRMGDRPDIRDELERFKQNMKNRRGKGPVHRTRSRKALAVLAALGILGAGGYAARRYMNNRPPSPGARAAYIRKKLRA